MTAEQRVDTDKAVLAGQLKRAVLYAKLAILTAPNFAKEADVVYASVEQRLHDIYGEAQLTALNEARENAKANLQLKPEGTTDQITINRTDAQTSSMVNGFNRRENERIRVRDESVYRESNDYERVVFLEEAQVAVDRLFESMKYDDVDNQKPLLYVLSVLPKGKQPAALISLEEEGLLKLGDFTSIYSGELSPDNQSIRTITLRNLMAALDLREEKFVVEPTIGMKRLTLTLHTFVGGFLSSLARAPRLDK